MIIAAYAVDCHLAFIYIRGEFTYGYRVMEAALAEARQKGFSVRTFSAPITNSTSFSIPAQALHLRRRDGLLESLEGKRGHPRQKPPFRQSTGCYGCPTVVNNVETLANLPHIFNRVSIGTKASDRMRKIRSEALLRERARQQAGCHCAELHSLAELIFDIAEASGREQVKGVIPGDRQSHPEADEIDVAWTLTLWRKRNTAWFSSCMVIDETAASSSLRGERRDSTRKRPAAVHPVPEGTWWMDQVLHRIEHGHGRMQDLDMILDMCANRRRNDLRVERCLRHAG
jgi:NADH-quinone oxidoreductase subunit F